MADTKFDAIIIGGGNKALVTAMYLSKYGGMKVGVFESRHELGGGWSSAELPLPGFLHDTHSSVHYGHYYHGPLWEDFPDWEEKGAKFIVPGEAAKANIYKEDHSCLIFYNKTSDPDQERTAKGIARFSQKDADTWLHWWGLWKKKIRTAYLQTLFNPAPLPGEPTPMDKVLAEPDIAIEPIWRVYPGIQFVKDVFESPEMHSWCLKSMRGHSGMPPDYPTGGLVLFITMFIMPEMGFIEGGGHQLTHASMRVIMENGGQFFTNSPVERVIIENGKAKGIRLMDGTEVEATQAVISTMNPYDLCFKLIGEEYLSDKIKRRVRAIIRHLGTITWNGWAVHEKAQWRAADFNPDINNVFSVNLVNKDPEQLAREYAWRTLKKFPPPEDTPTLFICHSMWDETRAPAGKHKYTSETFSIPADAISEREWLAFKKQKVFTEQAIWQEYAPNMTWDKIIDCYVCSPYDTKRLVTTGPSGEEHIISDPPSQIGSFRPIPELARHRTPIKNLYATGTGWPPKGLAASWQGYNCYKIMAEDYGLRRPWEEKGRDY